ncbi:hypothetical protein [Mycetocola sp. JXN-3]|uniref:hypothetical protein n=1 Tax=Mycetocola sp. JXN-3 TaxID=2116510 RepID=UPI001CAA81A2|nr:hypothetical protein [Mycetocola sp. JXN-3]
MSFWSKLSSSILVVLIGVLSTVLLVFSQGARLQQTVEEYPVGATKIYVHGVPEERAASVLAALGDFAHTEGRAVVRVDHLAADSSNLVTGMRIGIVANPAAVPDTLGLDDLGTSLFGSAEISRLLEGEPTRSIGLDANAADVLVPIPEFTFAPRIAVVQLAHLVQTSGTVNAAYRVVGASPDQVAGLLGSLESVTGQSAESMLTPMQGRAADGGLVGGLLVGFLVAATILLLLVLVFETLRAFRILGVHVLLGRSTWGFAATLFRPVLITAGITAVLSAGLTIALAPGYRLTVELASLAWSASAAGGILTLACVVVAAAALISTKPVNAILGRYSKKLLLWTLSGFYVVAIAAFTLTLVFLDGPIREANRLSDVNHSWASVKDQEILFRMSAGSAQTSDGGQSPQQTRDFYDWYRSIADKPGVSLVNTQYFDSQILDKWDGIYASVPEQPFWYVAASPSWLAEQGFHVDDALIARAHHGERVFLIPNSWSESTRTAVQGWLDENSHPSYEPAIRTEFFDGERVTFEGYEPGSQLFAWNTDPALPQHTTDPVILITTPENMVPTESESLAAVGLSNSYVKLETSAARDYTSTEYLASFHLDDKSIEFLPVTDFIAGLTKTIESIIQLFGGVVLFLFVFCLVVLASVARLFALTYREALAVKRLLGYSLGRLFAPALFVVGGTGILAIIVAILSQSTSALGGTIVMLVVQSALLIILVRRYSRLQLGTTLKE